MQHIKNLVPFIILFFCFVSCKKEEITAENAKPITEVQYIYQGSTYLLKFQEKNGEHVLLEGKDNEKIQQILDGPNTAVFVNLNNQDIVHLFDNAEQRQEFISNKNVADSKENLSKARTNLVFPTATVYEHGSYTGYQWQLPTPTDQIWDPIVQNWRIHTRLNDLRNYSVAPLSPTSWNDLITSVMLNNFDGTTRSFLTIYTDLNLSGRSITFEAFPGEAHGTSHLFNFKWGAFNQYNWDNKTTSIDFWCYAW